MGKVREVRRRFQAILIDKRSVVELLSILKRRSLKLQTCCVFGMILQTLARLRGLIWLFETSYLEV